MTSNDEWFETRSIALRDEPDASCATSLMSFQLPHIPRAASSRRWAAFAAAMVAGGLVVGYFGVSRAGDAAPNAQRTRSEPQARTLPDPPRAPSVRTVRVEPIVPVPAPAPAPIEEPTIVVDPQPEPVVAPPRKRAKRSVAVAPSSGSGILMISAKPPCDIIIDGARTGLVTPQRSIPLRAGHHAVRLVNAEQHVDKTLSVTISADHSTKLIQNLLAR